jgi:hypothetical protein
MMSNADIGERCASMAESLEGDSRLVEFVDDHHDREEDNLIEVMEHRYTVTDSGDVREVEAVVTVGGPHIVIECLSGVVSGSWGLDTHRCHVDSDQVEQYGRRLAERMEARIDQ